MKSVWDCSPTRIVLFLVSLNCCPPSLPFVHQGWGTCYWLPDLSLATEPSAGSLARAAFASRFIAENRILGLVSSCPAPFCAECMLNSFCLEQKLRKKPPCHPHPPLEEQKMTSCPALLQGFGTRGNAAYLSYLLIPYSSSGRPFACLLILTEQWFHPKICSSDNWLVCCVQVENKLFLKSRRNLLSSHSSLFEGNMEVRVISSHIFIVKIVFFPLV